MLEEKLSQKKALLMQNLQEKQVMDREVNILIQFKKFFCYYELIFFNMKFGIKFHVIMLYHVLHLTFIAHLLPVYRIFLSGIICEK